MQVFMLLFETVFEQSESLVILFLLDILRGLVDAQEIEEAYQVIDHLIEELFALHYVRKYLDQGNGVDVLVDRLPEIAPVGHDQGDFLLHLGTQNAAGGFWVVGEETHQKELILQSELIFIGILILFILFIVKVHEDQLSHILLEKGTVIEDEDDEEGKEFLLPFEAFRQVEVLDDEAYQELGILSVEHFKVDENGLQETEQFAVRLMVEFDFGQGIYNLDQQRVLGQVLMEVLREEIVEGLKVVIVVVHISSCHFGKDEGVEPLNDVSELEAKLLVLCPLQHEVEDPQNRVSIEGLEDYLQKGLEHPSNDLLVQKGVIVLFIQQIDHLF